MLVISMVSTVNTVSTSPASTFPLMLTAHTLLDPQVLLLTTITLAVHTSQKQKVCLTYFTSSLPVAKPLPPPSDPLGNMSTPPGHLRMMTVVARISYAVFYHSYHNIQNILFRKA